MSVGLTGMFVFPGVIPVGHGDFPGLPLKIEKKKKKHRSNAVVDQLHDHALSNEHTKRRNSRKNPFSTYKRSVFDKFRNLFRYDKDTKQPQAPLARKQTIAAVTKTTESVISNETEATIRKISLSKSAKTSPMKKIMSKLSLESLRRSISKRSSRGREPKDRKDSIVSSTNLADEQVTSLLAELKEKNDAIMTQAAELENLKQQLCVRSPKSQDDKPTSGDQISEKASHSATSESSDVGDRRDWEKIHAISDSKLANLLLTWVPLTKSTDKVRVIRRTEGTYHHVVFLELRSDDAVHHYVIRIPAHGTPEQWQEEDGYMLENEAKLMRYIKRHTNVPIPEVVMWDDTVWNPIEAPFIIMKALPGKPAYELWFDGTKESRHLTADFPLASTERKRTVFLRSLAQAMAELGRLKFSQIGMPCFDNLDDVPVIGRSYHWFSGDPKDFSTRCPISTTREYFMDRLQVIDLQGAIRSGNVKEGSKLHASMVGYLRILDMIISTPAFAPAFPSTETFTLRHSDLDLQNILVEDEGNITGIIDWDGCIAAPRCVGSAAAPKFLCADWLPGADLDRWPHLAWKLKNYRKKYAKALREFGCEDAVYTQKSAMYQALMDALAVNFDVDEFIYRVISELPECRGVDPEIFVEKIGYGWPSLENILKKSITRLFTPDKAKHLQVSTEEAPGAG